MFAGRRRMALATALLAVFLAAAIVMMDGAWGSSRGSERRHRAALLNSMWSLFPFFFFFFRDSQSNLVRVFYPPLSLFPQIKNICAPRGELEEKLSRGSAAGAGREGHHHGGGRVRCGRDPIPHRTGPQILEAPVLEARPPRAKEVGTPRAGGQQFHKNNTKTKMAKRRPPRRGRGGGRALGRITPLGAAAF